MAALLTGHKNGMSNQLQPVLFLEKLQPVFFFFFEGRCTTSFVSDGMLEGTGRFEWAG